MTPAMFLSDGNSLIHELHRIGEALGDSTRRSIFLMVREAAHPLTATEVANAFGLHRTVARGHLERLVEGGLLGTAHLHRKEGGRPPKVYSASDGRLNLQLPVRQYELLSELLLETLEKFGDAAEILLREVGFAFGERLADSALSDSPVDRLGPLRRAGAALEAEADGEKVHLRLKDCLFRELSARQPKLVCALDRALMEGLLSTPTTRYVLCDVKRRCAEDDVCRLTYAPSNGGNSRDHVYSPLQGAEIEAQSLSAQEGES